MSNETENLVTDVTTGSVQTPAVTDMPSEKNEGVTGEPDAAAEPTGEESGKPDAAAEPTGEEPGKQDAAAEPTGEEPGKTDAAAEPTGTETILPDCPAQKLLNNIVFGWNLGNTFDSYNGTAFGAGNLASETSWGNPATTEALFDLLKENGINAVRIPVTWFNHMDSEYVIDEAWMNRVQEVVDYAVDRDMYVIINVHHDTGVNGWLKASDTDLDKKKEIFTKIWVQVSDRFRDYDETLMFEGFNEILNDKNDWTNPGQRAVEITNELNRIFVDTVRASGGNNASRILICNTYCAGAAHAMIDGFELPQDSVEGRLAVEAHVYAPYSFTASEFPDVKTWSKYDIYENLKALKERFVDNGIPVIIGEFGCVDKGNEEARVSWAQYFVETAEKAGLKCFWWDNGVEFVIFSRKTLKLVQPNILGVIMAAIEGTDFMPDYGNEEADDNLCANVDRWSGWIDTANGAVATQDYLENGIRINVEASGNQDWYIQGSYTNLTLEKGQDYQVEFDYSATEDIPIQYLFQKNNGNYDVYHQKTVNFTTEEQHYSCIFRMSKDTDNQVSFVIDCGNRNSHVPFSITVTNLSLKKQKPE